MLRVAIVLLAGLVVSGCGVACTLIGCNDSVSFQLGTAAQHFGLNEPVLVKACAGARCAEETVTLTADGSSSTGPALRLGSGTLVFDFNSPVSGAVTVSLELKKNGNVVFTSSRDGVTFSNLQPNGPGCAPVCQQATLTL